MIRFIIVKEESDVDLQFRPKPTHITLDLEVPELEAILKKGGKSQYGYEFYQLVGVELIKQGE